MVRYGNNFKNANAAISQDQIFPENLLGLLAKHMKNLKATLDADPQLAIALKHYDPANDKNFIFELETVLLSIKQWKDLPT